MERPRLKAHFQTEVVDSSRVFLLAEGQHFFVEGRAAVAVLPYLDGRHTVGEIVSRVAGDISFPDALHALRKYQLAGHLAEGRPPLPDGALAFWESRGVDPASVVAAATEVLVVGELGANLVTGVLQETGLRARRVSPEEAAGADADGITVALVDDYLDPLLARLNAAYLANGRHWLLVRPTGTTVWLGPLLRPGHTGCWACIEQRITGNRQVARYLVGKRGEVKPRLPNHAVVPATTHLAAAALAAELGAIVAGQPSTVDGQLVTFDLTTLQSAEHLLIRQPQCPACGDPTLISARTPKVALSARPARHTTDGGYRVQRPQETFDRLRKHISPILGAVTSLRPHDDAENGITYSFTAGHNFAMVNDNIDLLRRNLRGQSGGKGRTEIQARVSAVCEAIERYAGVWHGNEPVVRAPADDLDGAVAPDELLLFSAEQVAGRAEWNADPAHRLHLVPEPFERDRPIDWSRAWSLTHDTERLLPAGYAWYGHPDLGEHLYCVTDSNGGASGNTLEEAVLQGFCEIVERDAVALWWYNRVRRPLFDLDCLDDPYIGTLRDFYATMQRRLWVLDLTSDLGVPTFAAVSNREHPVQDIMVGFGAHLDPRIAVIRALTEVNQFLPFVDRRDANGNTIYRTDDLETLEWCRTAKLETEPWLVADPTQPPRTLASYEPLTGDDLAGHVDDCVRRAAECGLEVIVLDQSRPDLELAVVKVVVPGMRHFWRRLGPGRLYDVPVALGWLAAPHAEHELNDKNVFF